MVKALSFKGEKKIKKRKRPAEEREENPEKEPPNKALTTTTLTEDDDSWVSAEIPTDIVGPVVFTLPTIPISCIACDAHGKIFASEIENVVDGDPSTTEPHDVRQVWVASKVAGTENFSFKGHHGKYLGCDKFGIVSATKEAISSEESFICIPVPDSKATFSLQTSRETYLTADDAKDISSTSIRGDADAIGFNTTFRIRMQARFKPKLKATKEEKALSKISRKELEDAVGRRLEDDEIKLLKKARKEGNYHEALLDVKVKGKHDKVCRILFFHNWVLISNLSCLVVCMILCTFHLKYSLLAFCSCQTTTIKSLSKLCVSSWQSMIIDTVSRICHRNAFSA